MRALPGLVLLACFLFGSEAAGGGCRKLKACSKVVRECNSFLDLITKEKVISSVCKKRTRVTRCIDRHETSCSNEHLRNDAKAVKDILQYMCTGHGRKLIQILSESQCAEDLISLEMSVLDCIDTFEFSLETDALRRVNSKQGLDPSCVCPHVKALDRCLIDGSYQLCGEDWGTFVADVWRIFSRDEMSQFGCTKRQIRMRRSAKMARPLFRGKSAGSLEAYL